MLGQNQIPNERIISYASPGQNNASTNVKSVSSTNYRGIQSFFCTFTQSICCIVPSFPLIRWLRRYPLLYLLVCMGAINTYGQSSTAIFQHISTEQGLPNFYTTATVQDKAGFIWLGTFSGLVRYDGHQFKNFTHERGNLSSLSSNYIRTVFVTRNGTIWVGTALGLNRLDVRTGQFERFYFNKWGSDCNNVRFVTEDAGGQLWVGTSGGLFVLNPQTEQIKQVYLPTDASSKTLVYSIHHILIDGEQVWIGTDLGLYGYHTRTKSFEVFCKNEELGSIPENAIYSLAKSSKTGHIAIGFRNGTLALFNPETRLFRKIPAVPSGSYIISTMICDKDGTFWVGSYGGGAFAYNETSNEFTVYQHDIYNATSLCSNVINNIFQDKSGLIWICSARDGVSRFNPAAQMFSYPLEEIGYKPLSANGVMIDRPFVDKFNNIWAPSDDGLIWANTATKQSKRYHTNAATGKGLLENNMNCVFMNQQGRVWVGTNAHFYELNTKTEYFTCFDHLPNDQNPSPPDRLSERNFIVGRNMFDMVERADGQIFIGTDEGLNLYDPRTQTFANRFNDERIRRLPINRYHSLYLDSRQNLWIGSGLDEVLCLSPDLATFKRYRSQDNDPNSLTENDVMSFAEDSKGNIWMGTDNGLGCLDIQTQRFRTYTSQDGLPNNNISALIRQGKYIWIGTSNGLCRYDETNHKFERFGNADNLKVFNTNIESVTQDHDGYLLFGGVHGLVRLNPNKLKINAFIPPVVITSVKVYGQEMLPTPLIAGRKTIVLEHDENDLSIEAAALNYDRPEKNLYTFWLENAEKKWRQSTTNPSLNYLNLLPGKYILHVKAANNDGIWNTKDYQLSIVIRPPFWQTWWFRTFAVLLITGIGAYLYQRRVRLIRQQHSTEVERLEDQRNLQNQLNQELKEKLTFQHQLETAQKQQAEIERKAILLERETVLGRYHNLVNQLNPHFLFNSLAVLDSLIYKDHKLASKYLRQLTKVYRYLIENDDQEVVQLDQEIRFAKDFIGLLQMRYGDGLQIDMVISEGLSDKKIVPVTIQNLIENAIKHNTTAGESPLRISIWEENGYLLVKNNLQKRSSVDTSNKKGLNDFKALYSYLTTRPVRIKETNEFFSVGVPLIE